MPKPSSASSSFEDEALPPSSFLIDDGGPPRFYSPIPPRDIVEGRSKDASELPLLFFLPGIDGVGLAAARQWPKLASLFDLRVMAVPADDRTSLDGLIEIVAAAIEAEGTENIPQSRPIYLAGESFGGSLTLLVAARARGLVDRLIVINPATSYSRSAWSAIAPLIARAPASVYGALPLALAPALGNPLAIMSGAVSASWASSPTEAARQLAGGASELLPQLRALGGALPAATLEWRLGLIKEAEARLLGGNGNGGGGGGDEETSSSSSSKKQKTSRPLLNEIKQRTLVIAGGNDTLLPSSDEADRLEKSMPRAKKVLLPRAGHALLQEGGVDLGSIAVEQGFYSRERRFSSSAGVVSKPRTRTGGGGAADPVDLPTPKELDNWTERATSLSRRLTSPVFFSFSGKKEVEKKESESERDETSASSFSGDQLFSRGLDGIPTDARPILFIGNHQLMALDMGVLVEELYREKDILMRGLAHPAIFSGMRGGSEGGEEVEEEKKKEGEEENTSSPSSPSLPRLPSFLNSSTSNSSNRAPPRSANRFEAFMTEWGAVPVSGRNFFKLMAQGEAVLLFPGGAREAYKRRGEDYALFWPEKSEFVRMVRCLGCGVEEERERKRGKKTFGSLKTFFILVSSFFSQKLKNNHNHTHTQASKFNGTIVPFAAVGCEDSITLALDSDELVNLPVVGPWIAERARKSVPPARRGVSASEDVEGLFLTPLAIPNGLPERQYFVFREPIQLDKSLADDREAAQAVYVRVKREVEDGIAWLREKREEDEYRFAGARLGYEIASGKQAPTFDPK